MKFKVTVKKDNKMWRRMKTNLLRGNGASVDTGWFNSVHPSGEYTAQIAAWNEEGHFNGGVFAGTVTPARPYIRVGFMPKAKNYMQTYYGDVHNIAMGRTTWAKLNRKIGTDLVRLMQETIHSWDKPANSPVTVALKGFNNPLIETGYMQQSVSYRIVKRSFR